MQNRLKDSEYCLKHILEDKNSSFKQCSFVSGKNGKRCPNTAPKSDRKEGYCPDHAKKAAILRQKAIRKRKPRETSESLLEELAQHHGPAAVVEAVVTGVRKSRLPSDGLANKVLDYASSSDSETEPPLVDQAWRGDGDSDAESIDSEQEDPLKHAGVFTAEEATLILRDKVIRLQSLYIDHFKRLQHILKEKRRKYLHSYKQERDTLVGIWRWCPHRRKGIHFLTLCLLLPLPSISQSNIPKDFEQAPQNDDIVSLLEEEAFISMKRNSSYKHVKDFRTYKDETGVETFTSLNRKYESSVNLLTEDAMLMSDFLPSEYNLNQERVKREIYEGSGGVNECTDLVVCNGPYETCKDRFEGYECTCIEGYTRDNEECFTEMFPSGQLNGDNTVSRQDDGTTRINVNDGIPFASKIYYRLYISTNGLISFNTRYASYSPRLPTYSQNILCPYWADIDITGSYNNDANIFYHVYDSARDSSMMDQASEYFERFASLRNFRPTWMLVVTWKNVAQRGTWTDTKRATFQVLLATNSMSTKVLYIYNRLAWTPRTDIPIYIGYESSYFYDTRRKILAMSNTRAAYTNRGISSNTGFPGVYSFDVGGHVINYAARCVNWYYQWLSDYHFNRWAFNRLPQCACTGFVMFWDRRFYWSRWYWESNGDFTECFTSRYNRRYWPLARECCYRNGWWLRRDSGRAMRYHPWWWYGAHYEADLKGKDYCCDKSNRCYLYNEIRPRDFCYFRFPFFFAWAFGDPHITTLDDRTYIFNGWGEYVMIKIEEGDNRFMLQARTERALSKNGTETKATVFTAFAATDYTDTYQVELSPSKEELVIYRNGKDLSLAFSNDANFTESDNQGGLTVERDEDDVVGVFASGISVRVRRGPKLLTVSVGMPTEYQNKTQGLMGNYNGDKTDDFIFPNGTSLPDNSPEAEIYVYGQAWQIDPASSYLLYPSRKNASDYAHPDFEPLYYDQASRVDRDAALAACDNDEKNLPCIFDFLATGDQAVADSTKQTDKTAGEERAEQSNTAPQVSSEKTILEVTVGQKVTFALNATDTDSDDKITYTILEGPDSGFNLTSENQNGIERNALATWTPTDAKPAKISITVQDSKNASSDPIDIEIRLCDGCSDHGACNFTETRTEANAASSEDFQLALCICDIGYTGDNCSIDFDGCEESPCSEGQNCTDLLPAEEEVLERAYNCSACPEGYAAVEDKCVDVDECNKSTDNCHQVCTNTEGSFSCSCRPGYRMVDVLCQDVNECVEGLHDCEQICTNNDGGFTCSCEDLFYLDVDNKSCIENETAANPCLSKNCEYGCRKNEEGDFTCFCKTGYELNPADNRTCKDTDECNQNVCAQKCENNVGSFTCSCYDGFILADDKITCTECSDLTYGKNCEEQCDCGDRFSECNNVRGCICNSGWRGTKCDVDVDECEENPNSCDIGLICANTNGSFECNCPSGYEKQTDGSCKDINECETEANTCSQDCNNVAGAFTCTCRTGYTVAGDNCTDVDECESDQNSCEQKCKNVEGSYNCECEFGYQLMNDRTRCEQVENVCQSEKNLNCSHGCTVEAETEEAYCFCQRGYNLGTDKQSCLDIIECKVPEENKCSHTCTNTKGGFTCSCPIGFQLDSDRITCRVCDDHHWGVECMEVCECGVGAERCDSETGCVCKTGWLGTKCDQDRDECSDVNVICPANSACVNNPGSYRCECRTGYMLNTNTNLCDDIDECEPERNTCDQNCQNTDGSFVCQCRDGFTREGDRCQNIDECETGNNECEQLCRDTEGSYACSCRPGFLLQTADRRSCVAHTECQNLNCSQNCQVDTGTESCFCNSGFKLDNDNVTCVDINECAEGTDPCAAGGATCHNSDNGTGYTCQCDVGFKLQNDRVSCMACEPGLYGQNCATNCTCEPANTETCDKADGKCNCITGWKGTNCETDIDECGTGVAICGLYAECKNTNGSHLCVCAAGYFRAGDNCSECDSKHWGINCVNPCTCSVNSISCNATNGVCTCKVGWKNVTCATDVNECDDNSSICSGTANSHCVNTNGSHTCECNDGFLLNPDTDMCDDIDECLDTTLNDCTQECINTIGNRTCYCSVGYTGTWNNCTDFDECEANDTACSGFPDTHCQNKPGTYECECDEGYYKNVTTDKCEDVDECKKTPTICDGQANTECENLPGSSHCICKSGFVNNTSTNECEDIDECEANDTLCSGIPDTHCQNKPGTYECECDEGYKNATTDKCEDVDECKKTPTICDGQANTECENLPGSSHCICKSGFVNNTSTNECEDIDECKANDTLCSGIPDTHCQNKPGTYECECDEGYKNATTDKCEDVDECKKTPTICDGQANTECGNLPGSSHCICKSGFVNNTSTNECEDIDECKANDTLCSGIPDTHCQNKPGTYECECDEGYKNATTDKCEDVDECKKTPTICDGQANTECENLPGSSHCICKSGFVNNTSTNECEDIDECKANDTLCSGIPDTHCQNKPGTYECECDEGYKNATTDKCEDVDECKKTPTICDGQANTECENLPGSSHCICKSGFVNNTSTNECEDVDECKKTPTICDGQANTECENLPGSSHCICKSGFVNNTSTNECEDIDECKANDTLCSGIPDTHCQNKPGTYECECDEGYKNATTDKCEDVDECKQTPTICDGQANTECENLPGSSHCSCKSGFVNNTSTNECEDVDECKKTPTICDGQANTECENLPGSSHCICKSGFVNNTSTNECEDIDECKANDTLCSGIPDTHCQNKPGTYECECDEGYKNATTDKCEDVDECKQTPTICDGQANTECENLPGSSHCSCKSGFVNNTSTNECEDVDECKKTPTICDGQANTECENLPGSSHCICKSGFVNNTSTNECEDIDECKANDTLCSGIPDTHCQNKPGTYECECDEGYKNATTDKCEDVDECKKTPTICDGQANTECENLPGSSHCICKSGFVNNTSTNECEDIDECKANDTLCSGIPDTHCQNKPGTYECECDEGYKNATTDKCEDVDECKKTPTICDGQANTECENLPGSSHCICKSGFVNNTSTNECEDVDECKQTPTICDGQANTECENLPGSSHCSCKSGFVNNTSTNECEDINECNRNHGCAFRCVNLNGSSECICQDNFVIDIDGKSCNRVKTIEATTRLEKEVEPSVFANPNRQEYKNLVDAIAKALKTYFRITFGDALLSVIVIRISSGSVVVDYNTIINSALEPNAEGKFIKAANDLINTNLKVGGDPALVKSVTINGTNVTDDLCQTFKQVRDCGAASKCMAEDGVPDCKKIPESNDYRLIIGLSIGIPIFLVIVATIIAVLVIRTKNKNKYNEPMDDGNDNFPRPFASQMATRSGFYSANRGMYSPDSLSAASSDSDRKKKKKNGRSSFRDSLWFNKEERPDRDRVYDNDVSNFSWDFLYRIMPPNETFEIRRPQVNASESPLRSTRKYPFSSA